ncbi:uncharacterized protein LOC143913086 [Arctopsyche grandis]|uniref:uncharacterized protein LOC143913086 n=1 Tax=Arctopsyche grandis TaxID=121162 RepID=UPI00406D7BA2
MQTTTLKDAKNAIAIVIFVNLFQTCYSGDIYELEYSKLPKLFTLDPYEECFLEPGGLYCVVDIQLQAQTVNDIWYLIKNYSSEPLAHLRHDILHKGICVTKRCNVSEEHSKNVTYDKKIVESFLTKCMTRELEEAYQLEGNVSVRYCEDKVYSRSFNIFDWVYVAIILGIVIMNGIGTVYDVWRKKREIKLDSRNGRLTPVYAVVLGFLCTLYDYMGSGPLWQDNIVIEADACRQLWWTHFIYINNYLDVPTACYDITWYLAADMQLFCYGTLVMMIIWKFPSLSRYVFGLLMIIAIIVPGLQTYIFNYYPIIPPYSE